MKNVFVEALKEAFDLTAMLAKIDYHHIRGNLSDDDREELIALAREKANPFGGVDVMHKLEEIEARLRKLEEASSTESEQPGETTVDEYVAGKWYYAGDKVQYKGKVYTCIAPDGIVCTWNPEEYPAYWEVDAE